MSQNNPLEKFFRQPKMRLRLPSGGKWYPKGALELDADGLVPVFAMTAKDDLLFKRGEALIERQSMLELLQSCIPAIKMPEVMPGIDLDACLLAIRKASYGDELKLNAVVPVVNTVRVVSTSISSLLENQGSAELFDEQLIIQADDGSEMKVIVKPIPLSALLQSTKSIIAQGNIFKTVDSDTIDDEKKIARINEAFKLINKVSTEMVLESIVSLEAEGQVVTSTVPIKLFLQNCDAAYFNAIKDHVEAQRKVVSIKPLVVNATPDEIAKGAPETFTVDITFANTEFIK